MSFRISESHFGNGLQKHVAENIGTNSLTVAANMTLRNPCIEFPVSRSQKGTPVLYSLNPTGSAWSRPRDVPLSNSYANARGIPTRTVKWLGGRSVVHLCSTLMCPSSCVGTLTAPRGFAQTPRSSPIRGGSSCIAL